jgi:hypothetical protein
LILHRLDLGLQRRPFRIRDAQLLLQLLLKTLPHLVEIRGTIPVRPRPASGPAAAAVLGLAHRGHCGQK